MRWLRRLVAALVVVVAFPVLGVALTSPRGAAHSTGAATRIAATTHGSIAAATSTAAPSPTSTPAPTAAATVTVSQTTRSIDVNGSTRQYLQISPNGATSPSVPIVVVLGGIQASVQLELSRDDLLPLAQEGSIELVYPVGFDESWNAGGCCGDAAAEGVDDTTFIEDLVATLDPGHMAPVFLVGYSNGGRLAYTLACADPALVDAFAVVKAVPVTPCASQAPVTILQIAATDDWEVPYQPGDSGDVSPPVTQQVALLQQSNGCGAASTTTVTGSLTDVTWTACAQGTRLAFATYSGGSHLWPAGDATTPAAAAVIEAFFGIG